jgi:hypothetical protein
MNSTLSAKSLPRADCVLVKYSVPKLGRYAIQLRIPEPILVAEYENKTLFGFEALFESLNYLAAVWCHVAFLLFYCCFLLTYDICI